MEIHKSYANHKTIKVPIPSDWRSPPWDAGWDVCDLLRHKSCQVSTILPLKGSGTGWGRIMVIISFSYKLGPHITFSKMQKKKERKKGGSCNFTGSKFLFSLTKNEKKITPNIDILHLPALDKRVLCFFS